MDNGSYGQLLGAILGGATAIICAVFASWLASRADSRKMHEQNQNRLSKIEQQVGSELTPIVNHWNRVGPWKVDG